MNIDSVMFKAQIKLFVILAAFVISSKSYATIYYVDATNGKDENNGRSPSTAWKTIAKINSSNFAPGDSVLFKKGEAWQEQLLISSSGSWGKPITFGAYGNGDKPILDGNHNMWGLVFLQGYAYITMTNLTFQNSEQHAIKTGESASDYIIFENCTFQDNGGCAISGSPGCDFWIIRNNFIINCGKLQDNDSIYLNDGTTYWEIYNNRIYNSGGDDIAVAGSGHRIYRNDFGPSTSLSIGISIDPTSTDILIYENKIHEHDIEGIVVKGPNCKIFKNQIYENGCDGILINGDETKKGLEIYQNVIWGHHDSYSGISLWVGGDNAKIYNNVIFNNDIGINLHQGQLDVVISNNIIMANKIFGFIGGSEAPQLLHNNCYNIGTNYSGVGDPTGINGNISQDALFTDASNYDFTLQPGSPCIDAGINVGLPYYGKAPDLGAFEFITNPIYPKPKKYPTLVLNTMTLNIFPNPTNSSTVIHIIKPVDVNSIELKIINIKGQIVMESTIVGSSSQIEVNWNLQDKYQKQLSSGVYFVIVRDYSQQVIEKLLILE